MQEHTFFNHTQVNSSSTRYPVSAYPQGHPVSAASSTYDTSGTLGYGVGRLLREAFDRLYEGWHHWWYPAPSKEVLAQRRQVALYRKRLEAAMIQLDMAVEELHKNPHAKNNFERFKRIIKESDTYLSPAPTEKLRRYQRQLLNQIRTKIERLNVKSLRRTLLTYLPSLPAEATSITDTSNSHRDTEGASDVKRKRSVAAQAASGFQPSFDLRTLDGTNGFVVNGISGGDGLGSSVNTAGDINGDGKSDLVLGAPGVSNYAAVYVMFGQDNFLSPFDLTTLDGTNGFVVNGISSYAQLGYSVNTAGDLNGDGKSDLVLGAPGDYSTNNPGLAYVIFGQGNFPSPFNLTTLDGTNGFVVNGIANNDFLGSSVSMAGDLNGDGTTDLVLGAPGDYSTNNQGSAYVIFGQKNPFPSPFNLTTLDGTNGFVVNGIGSGLGSSVNTAGDLNRDGTTDLVLGAPRVSRGAGAAYVIFGQDNFPSPFNLTTLDGTNGFVVNGISSYAQLGYSVNTAGDLNGDGITDLVLGAPGDYSSNSPRSAVYVIFGQMSRFSAAFNLITLNGTNGFVVEGIALSDQLGSSVNTAGDLNEDGTTDLVLGAPGFSNSRGAAYVIFGQGNFPSPFDLITLDGTNGFMVNGIATKSDQLGSSVSTAGDLNGDGTTDLVLGAPRVSSGAGAAYVIFGVSATPTNSLPIALIIGSAIGGLFGLVSLIGLGYGVYRRCSPKPKPVSEHEPPIELMPVAGDESSSRAYQLVEANDHEKRKVIAFYQHCPVSGYEIASIHVIHHAGMNDAFASHLKTLQQRENDPAFKAQWPTGRENPEDPVEPLENTEWRHVVDEQLKTLSEPYQDSNYPAVNLVPVWYGAPKEKVDSLLTTGLATMETGFYGKGIYSAYEADYAYRAYAQEGGTLILHWVACFSAYPVINYEAPGQPYPGDMNKFLVKNKKGHAVSIGGAYSNYDAHFIPVVPRNPDDRDETVYYPTKPYDKHQYIELVVFESVACLPRYVVELQRTLAKPLPLNRNEYRGVFFPLVQEEEGLQQEPTPENPSLKLTRFL